MADRCADEREVVFGEGFEVAGARGEAAAVGGEVGDDFVEEFGLLF